MEEVDVIVADPPAAEQLVVHVGSASVPARVRRLHDGALRLRLARPLPLRLGDRLLLRDPGRRAVAGADVADLAPLPLRRRGDARRVGAGLRAAPTADEVVARHGVVSDRQLHVWGCPDDPGEARRVGKWWVAPQPWATWRSALEEAVRAGADELSPGVSVEDLRHRLGLADPELVLALAAEAPGLVVSKGHVRAAADGPPVPAELVTLTARLAADPLDAPDATELRALDPRVLAHGVRTGLVLHLGAGVYVAPDAPRHAADRLAALPQPFTAGDARTALGVTRRVAIPLLEHLDAARVTRRLEDGRRVLAPPRG